MSFCVFLCFFEARIADKSPKGSKSIIMMKKRIIKWSMLAMVSMLLVACSENYSRGEKVGTVIEFAQSGLIWDSWDGRLNLTQTGMNTAGEPFTFSLDNDRKDQQHLVDLLYQAQIEGWKIKIKLLLSAKPQMSIIIFPQCL